jgi:hypothetical protein
MVLLVKPPVWTVSAIPSVIGRISVRNLVVIVILIAPTNDMILSPNEQNPVVIVILTAQTNGMI